MGGWMVGVWNNMKEGADGKGGEGFLAAPRAPGKL